MVSLVFFLYDMFSPKLVFLSNVYLMFNHYKPQQYHVNHVYKGKKHLVHAAITIYD